MKTYYKLTDKDGYTRRGESNETLWGENVEHKAIGDGNELCSDGFIHAYESPQIAVLMNPIHSMCDLTTALLWECHLQGRTKKDGQLKCGAKGCTTLRKIPLPIITTKQLTTIAIKLSLLVYNDVAYVEWATAWLSGTNRTESAAESAAWSAAWSARSAAESAESAAWSAESAAWSARSAAESAESAAWSAQAARIHIDILSIIKETIGQNQYK